MLSLSAVKGQSYCSSAARAVQLIVSNALRLAAVNIVGDAVLFLGKLGIAACCGVVAFAMSNLEYYNNMDKYPATYLSSGIMPIAVAVLTGYIVAQVSHMQLVTACLHKLCPFVIEQALHMTTDVEVHTAVCMPWTVPTACVTLEGLLSASAVAGDHLVNSAWGVVPAYMLR